MSQNDTWKWAILIAFGFLVSAPAFAQGQPFKACVDQQLLGMGVNPAMQNRWNPNTIAGKLQIIAISRCKGILKVGEAEGSQPALVMPASFEEKDSGAATGIREI